MKKNHSSSSRGSNDDGLGSFRKTVVDLQTLSRLLYNDR